MLLCVLLIYRTLFKILIECPLIPPEIEDGGREYQECLGLIRLDLPLCFTVTSILFVQAWPVITQHWLPWSPFLLLYRITSPSLGELTVKFTLTPPTNANTREAFLQQSNNLGIFSTLYISLYELYFVLKSSLVILIRKINIRLFMLVYTTSYRSVLPLMRRLIALVVEGVTLSQKQEEQINTSHMNITGNV